MDCLTVQDYFSAPGHKSDRNAIRSTWGDLCATEKCCELRFLVGLDHREVDKAVEIESAGYGDVEVVAARDTYDGIVKKVLRLMEEQLSSEYTHILKTDDDSFVNIRKILTVYPKAQRGASLNLKRAAMARAKARDSRNCSSSS